MATTETNTDDTNDVVQTFNEAFDYVSPLGNVLHDNEFDGDGWLAGNNAVVLVSPDVTHVGDIDMDCFEPTDYIGTQTLEYEPPSGDTVTNRVYTFTTETGCDQHVRVEYVRTLANEVFDVDYSTIRSWAQTTTDESCMQDGDAPVLFNPPDSEYRVVVLPVITE